MKEIILHLETPDGRRELNLVDEFSFGRTELASIVLDDSSLSRLHATVWREKDELWVQDENSSNGTFVNGERLSGERLLRDGDEITIGNETTIYIEIVESKVQSPKPKVEANIPQKIAGPPTISQPSINPQSKNFPLIPIAAGASAFIIVIVAVAAVLIVRSREDSSGNGSKTNPPVQQQIRSGALIPMRVIDPLGGQDPDDLDDLISSWEQDEEKELDASQVEEIKVSTNKNPDLNLKVTREYFEQQRNKALNHSGGFVADRPGLMPLPPDMVGGGVPKQKAKLAELMKEKNYKQPMDFADLADLRLKGVLVEMPWATETFVLDVGGSAGNGEFTSYDFDNGIQPIPPGSEKYKILQKLADNFDGQKYDLNNPDHRRQMRMRLLRMYNAESRKVFEEICKAYYDKFKVPLRVTSLTRSMDYQIGLNKGNANSFKVTGKGSLPPHTSGCAFDMSRKNLSAEEQNFMVQLLTGMERAGKLDSLREGGGNPCYHTFIYPDGKPAK